MPLLTRKTRIIIMCFLIACFFVIAPMILMYTAGYRYNFKEKLIKRTGVLSIDIEPDDAEVYINNIKQKDALPLYLPNRAPGTYKLKLEKPGYKTWEKDISLESNKTTYIKKVILFKEALPTEMLSENLKILNASISPDGKFLTLIQQETNGLTNIEIYNTQTAESKSIWRAKTKAVPSIHWSPFGNWLLLQEPGAMQIIDAANTLSTNTIITSSTIQTWQWAPKIFAIYFQNENEIRLMDANSGQKYANTSTTMWFGDGENGWQYDVENKCLKRLVSESQKCVYDMPERVASFINADANKFILKTIDNNILVARIENDQMKEVKKLPVQNAVFNQQTREWLAWSPWELWTIYENGTATLLNRTSDEIKFVGPLDENGLLLIASENKILGFNPGYYVTEELLSNARIKSINADISNRKIYFWGEIGEKLGVWELGY